MNLVDVKSSTCIEFNKENNNGGEKLKSSWSYKNIEIWKHFCKRLPPNLSEEVFVIQKVETHCGVDISYFWS